MNQSRNFSIKEQLKLIYHGAKGFVVLRKNRKHRRMTKALKERIMLAVTHVNGCAMCSFIHTKLALESGMSNDQIKAILDGDFKEIPTEEAVAVLFGQHYADTKEQPSSEAIDRLIEEYGYDKTECIVSACAMITMTNGMGISMDNLYHRITFRRNRNSNVLSELFNPLLTMILFPILVLAFQVKRLISNVRVLPPKYRMNQS